MHSSLEARWMRDHSIKDPDGEWYKSKVDGKEVKVKRLKTRRNWVFKDF
jgi:hypothetical protein